MLRKLLVLASASAALLVATPQTSIATSPAADRPIPIMSSSSGGGVQPFDGSGDVNACDTDTLEPSYYSDTSHQAMYYTACAAANSTYIYATFQIQALVSGPYTITAQLLNSDNGWHSSTVTCSKSLAVNEVYHCTKAWPRYTGHAQAYGTGFRYSGRASVYAYSTNFNVS